MSLLERIKKDGFDIEIVDGDFIEVSPADKLTSTQLEFLKSHKAEIVSELKAEALRIRETLISCGQCLNFRSHNAHGQGAGLCLSGVQPNGSCWWGETEHQCDKFDARVEWQVIPEPEPDAIMVIAYTPAGKPIRVQAKNPEHAELLRRMNPQRVTP